MINKERVFTVLMGAHVSEKTSIVSEHNQFTFKVAVDSTKREIKHAVEKIF